MDAISRNTAWRTAGLGRIAAALFAALVIMLSAPAASLAAGTENAQHKHHIKDFVVTIDTQSAKTFGPDVVKQITDFFDYADNAIMTKNLDALAFLYSDQYRDGNHKKADVVEAWRVLFSEFDDFSMTHNLRIITADAGRKVMIVGCSGILMAKPRSDKMLRALDHWMNINHVLVKESNGWKIIGSGGAEEKRLWFDKPLHPLF